jgi:hypothetical protein
MTTLAGGSLETLALLTGGRGMQNGGLANTRHVAASPNVWILSSATTPQPANKAGVWLDASAWTDTNVWYD